MRTFNFRNSVNVSFSLTNKGLECSKSNVYKLKKSPTKPVAKFLLLTRGRTLKEWYCPLCLIVKNLLICCLRTRTPKKLMDLLCRFILHNLHLENLRLFDCGMRSSICRFRIFRLKFKKKKFSSLTLHTHPKIQSMKADIVGNTKVFN